MRATVEDRPATGPAGGVARRFAEQVRWRAGALVAAALLVALVLTHWRPPAVCLLRNVTGVPCPFCGGTTAMADLGQGDLRAAFAASPLVVLGAPLWVLWPRLRPWWARLTSGSGRRAVGVVLAVAAASELWQIQRVLG